MTEIKLTNPLYFLVHNISSNQVNRRIGRSIYQSPAWGEKIGHEALNAETEPVEFAYTSKHIAFAFLSEIRDRVSIDIYQVPGFEDASLTQFCNLVLEHIALLEENTNFHASDISCLKQYFLTSLIFGMCSESNTVFSFFSWQSRRWANKITLRYERSEEVSDIIAEHFTSVAISSSENSGYTVYPTGTIEKYEIGGTTVYSKIPETIAKSFSYFLNVNDVSSYLNTSNATRTLPDHSGKTLMTGPTCDILFEEDYSEEYNAAMDSSEKVNAYYLKTPYRGSISLQQETIRKKTLRKICSIIPLINKVVIVDPATLEPTEVNFLRIRINAPSYKFYKYKSSRAFLESLPSKFFSYEGLSWIDPVLYVTKMRELLGDISKYNPDFVSKIMDSNIDISTVHIPKNNLPVEAISNSAFRYHEVNLAASENSELENLAAVEASYNSLSERVTTWIADRERVRTAARNSDSLCKRHRGNIEYYTGELERIKKLLEDEIAENLGRTKDIDKLTANINAVSDSLSELEKQVEAGKSKKIELALSSADSVNVTWLDNVKKSNIEFNSSYYTIPALWITSQDLRPLVVHSLIGTGFDPTNAYNNFYISIEDCPQLAFYAQEKLPIPLELIFGDNAQQVRDMNLAEKMFVPALGFVNFSTIKPSVIRVDGSDTRQVVGGPYHVQVAAGISFYQGASDPFRMTPALSIKLKDESSAFGYNLCGGYYNLWVHPHTSSIQYPLDSNFFNKILNYAGHACLGDAGPSIYKGFREANVRTVVFAAKIWIESANSTDTWGRNYKYFPKVQDVILDDDSSEVQESQEISEVEVNEMLQDLMDQATGEEQPNQLVEPEVIIQTVTPVIPLQEDEAVERVNEYSPQAMQDVVGQAEPVIVESTPPDSPPSPAYTTYAEVITGN